LEGRHALLPSGHRRIQPFLEGRRVSPEIAGRSSRPNSENFNTATNWTGKGLKIHRSA
jgi:hypothetical protein